MLEPVMSEGITCYERDEVLCEDQMCIRVGCRIRNARIAEPSEVCALGKEVAKLMDKHGIAPAKPQFWLDLEALTSTYGGKK
jgi:hypothetical protein